MTYFLVAQKLFSPLVFRYLKPLRYLRGTYTDHGFSGQEHGSHGIYSLLLRNKLLQEAGETKLITNVRAIQYRENTILCLNLKDGKFPTNTILPKKVTINTIQKCHSVILLKTVWPSTTKPFVKGAHLDTTVAMPLWEYCFHN